MMEPVINPMWFYLIGIVDGINTLLTITGALTAGASIVYSLLALDDDYNKEQQRELKKSSRRFIIITIVFFTIAVFIPPPDTIIKMLVAENITYDRIEKLGRGTEEIKDELKRDILDIINAIKKENQETK